MHLLYREGQVRYPQEFHVICNGLLLLQTIHIKWVISIFLIKDLGYGSHVRVLMGFAKIDAYSHFTVLILISWLKFKTTSKLTTEEEKEPEQWRQQEQEQELRKKGILSKNNASTRAFEARYMVPPLSLENESVKWPTSLRGWGNW